MAGRPSRSSATLCAAWLTAGAAAAQAGIDSDFADRWVAPDALLSLRLDAGMPARELRVFIGRTDVSALLRSPAPGVLEIPGTRMPLPAGESELVLYRVAAGQWHELARLPLKVRGAGGFESSTFTPKAELQIKGRGLERGTASLRGTHADLVGQGGIGWKAARDGWVFEAQANLSAASHRGEALRFAELAGRAPKLDLADYRVAVAHGEHRLELGHFAVGNHPLLLNGLASRGLALRTRLGAQVDLSASTVSGTTIVGVDNLFGLDDAEHRVDTLSLGAELLRERPGGLRAELTLLDASVRARGNFNRGEVPDAERSRGLGARLLARSAGGRLRADLAFARSRFVNPFDPLLAQGGESQAVRPETRDAYSIDLQVDLLRQSAALSERHPLDLTLGLRQDRAEPLYKSLGASLDADRERRRVSLQAALAGAQLQLQLARGEDNLARIPTLLRTRTDERQLALNLPLPAWFDADATASRWPTLAWSWQGVHQRAVNAPPTEDSGFAATHLPDQLNATQQLNLGWTLPRGSLAYTLAWSRQDNRQIGRERADFANLAHQLAGSWTFGEALRASLDLQRSRNHSVELALTQRTLGGTLALDWQASERWALAGQLQASHANDSQQLGSTRSIGAQLQATRRFELPAPGRPLPGQAFVRLARQGDRRIDTVFDQAIDQRSWWLDLGLSFSLF
jgi:hypothetical protein